MDFEAIFISFSLSLALVSIDHMFMVGGFKNDTEVLPHENEFNDREATLSSEKDAA